MSMELRLVHASGMHSLRVPALTKNGRGTSTISACAFPNRRDSSTILISFEPETNFLESDHK
jgi:hypothetical protein